MYVRYRGPLSRSVSVAMVNDTGFVSKPTPCFPYLLFLCLSSTRTNKNLHIHCDTAEYLSLVFRYCMHIRHLYFFPLSLCSKYGTLSVRVFFVFAACCNEGRRNTWIYTFKREHLSILSRDGHKDRDTRYSSTWNISTDGYRIVS